MREDVYLDLQRIADDLELILQQYEGVREMMRPIDAERLRHAYYLILDCIEHPGEPAWMCKLDEVGNEG